MEQNTLFCLLPAHLADMAIFAVNTGCRDAEICNLLWGWEVAVRELQTSIFIIPGARVKNGAPALLEVRDVEFGYDDDVVLDGCTLLVPPRERFVRVTGSASRATVEVPATATGKSVREPVCIRHRPSCR